METGKRKKLGSKIDAIRRIVNEIDTVRDELQKNFGAEVVDDIQEKFQTLRKNLEAEKDKAPIGHLFNGVYYLKRPDYRIQAGEEVFEKKEGKLLMKEDLVSWLPERADGRYQGYIRNVYRKPDLSQELKRKDGEEVFMMPDSFW